MTLGKSRYNRLQTSLLTSHSVNCRLPQTPRTPTSAAAHYFDDVFTRQRRASLGGRRASGIARSMTRTRSIGARSDLSDKTGVTEGEGDDEEIQSLNESSRTWSIYKDDPKSGIPTHEDPDDPINKYVQEQLSRIKSQESLEFAEELAAQTDGTRETNGHY
jgi:hypothetical protein